jgi:hypothetical protein
MVLAPSKWLGGATIPDIRLSELTWEIITSPILSALNNRNFNVLRFYELVSERFGHPEERLSKRIHVQHRLTLLDFSGRINKNSPNAFKENT